MASKLSSMGYELVYGGMDNHLILIDVHNKCIDGAKVEKVLDLASITLNKISVSGDTSALVSGGIRIGTSALTTRGFVEEEFEDVATLISRGIELAMEADRSCKDTCVCIAEMERKSDDAEPKQTFRFKLDNLQAQVSEPQVRHLRTLLTFVAAAKVWSRSLLWMKGSKAVAMTRWRLYIGTRWNMVCRSRW